MIFTAETMLNCVLACIQSFGANMRVFFFLAIADQSNHTYLAFSWHKVYKAMPGLELQNIYAASSELKLSEIVTKQNFSDNNFQKITFYVTSPH